MRPFEFKIWNNVARQWEIGPCEYLHLGPTFVLSDDGDGDVIQFTGLIAENGQKVWEGDFVSIIGNPTEKFLVQFGEYQDCNYDRHFGFYLMSSKRPDVFYRFGLGEGQIESVTGNIYENPELSNI